MTWHNWKAFRKCLLTSNASEATTPFGFPDIKPINVLIGCNNSGKSTLLELIEYATDEAGVLEGQGP